MNINSNGVLSKAAADEITKSLNKPLAFIIAIDTDGNQIPMALANREFEVTEVAKGTSSISARELIQIEDEQDIPAIPPRPSNVFMAAGPKKYKKVCYVCDGKRICVKVPVDS